MRKDSLLQVLPLCNRGITVKYQTDNSLRDHLTNTAIKCSLYVLAIHFSVTASGLHRRACGPKAESTVSPWQHISSETIHLQFEHF